MHRTWEFDVKALLREGGNDIRITFFSPVKFIREAYAKKPLEGSSDAMRGFPYLRKAHCMFGWDWGPRLPDAGIWRDIELIGADTARLEDVAVFQHHEAGKVTLRAVSRTERLSGGETAVKVTVTAPDGQVFSAEGEDCSLQIENPKLWWPRGYGDQPLYTVKVTLTADGKELDMRELRIGLRTLTIHREKDEWGESFCHCVNGVDVFAMGADYIPEDNLLPRVNRERTRRLLEDAAAANMNAIRVWGGGYYPEDYFYDLCDEMGFLVWQDFMFACAAYDFTEEFEANLRAEFTDNIRRLRHHASLALWCGNNEIESFVPYGMWVDNKKLIADYIKLYEYMLPKLVKQEDPQTFYWPSSPSSGGTTCSAMPANSASSPSPAWRRSKALRSRGTGTCIPMLWKSTSGTPAPTARSPNTCPRPTCTRPRWIRSYTRPSCCRHRRCSTASSTGAGTGDSAWVH